jgi:hypothetical protein
MECPGGVIRIERRRRRSWSNRIGQDDAMTWISDMTTRIADATDIPVASLTIDADDADLLLRLAGIAAHESGERTNAPLLCHVLGRAVAGGAPLDELANIVEGLA